MKRISLILFLIAALLVGCGQRVDAPLLPSEPIAAEVPVETQAPTEAVVETMEDDVVYEGDATSYYTDVVYTQQIARYYTALSEQWEMDKYFENEMSASPYAYYEGNPLENVGFGFVDLDNDGSWELVIGAIANAETDPTVFEIWTLVDGQPVMIAQGGSRNRYVLQYSPDDEMWYVVNICSNSAANGATYYLMLHDGQFVVVQGILTDAWADEQNPWFLTYDLDWDASNDTPIDEETAMAILESNQKLYTALEYCPYLYFR